MYIFIAEVSYRSFMVIFIEIYVYYVRMVFVIKGKMFFRQ